MQKEDLKLYFICGTQDINDGQSIEQILKTALEAGITMFQFREKGSSALQGAEKEALARKLHTLCKGYNVPFIVNDDIELALTIEADGVHVGQNDTDVQQFRQHFTNKIIGLSVGTVEEYKQSDLSYIDYIGVGPMFDTSSKADANAPVGPTRITTLRSLVGNMPIVGIGGITTSNFQPVLAAGADGISVISAISKSDDITKTIRYFLQSVE
ncbi:thiamine phosphate synthase [Staphylococcus arlettae]|uniref:thiamine phosphate synthase n=1 Tax=Staphylococcus arlettae TaxID=29378 RepID=UPI000D1B94D2|nr:thiamine phosphate synthase [Staphylococcus arlettae]PTH30604.1 thiamine phosphate synthase [Staphylococcus arlettae]PTH52955.1 thiamine phosphate synthase [Staphylococcus arlettae]